MALATDEVGGGTVDEGTGTAPAKTEGKPVVDKRPWTSARAAGTGGSAESTVRKMAERSTAEVNQGTPDWSRKPAISHAEMSTLSAPKAAPAAASKEPRCQRLSVTAIHPPSTRPSVPAATAAPRTKATVSTVRQVPDASGLASTRAMPAPKASPSQNPRKLPSWTTAPRRRPWIAAAMTSTAMTMSIQPTGPRVDGR